MFNYSKGLSYFEFLNGLVSDLRARCSWSVCKMSSLRGPWRPGRIDFSQLRRRFQSSESHFYVHRRLQVALSHVRMRADERRQVVALTQEHMNISDTF